MEMEMRMRIASVLRIIGPGKGIMAGKGKGTVTRMRMEMRGSTRMRWTSGDLRQRGRGEMEVDGGRLWTMSMMGTRGSRGVMVMGMTMILPMTATIIREHGRFTRLIEIEPRSTLVFPRTSCTETLSSCLGMSLDPLLHQH
jgi:hypothetical protein